MESLSLAQQSAVNSLALSLYYLRSPFYGIAIEPWEALPYATRQRWIETALEHMKDVAPRPRRVEKAS